MKILLVGINAKYIHTCPAIYSLRSYALARGEVLSQIELAEYTINDRYEDVRMGILEREADVIAFSTYIWNVDRTLRLIRDIKRIRGEEVLLWAGGPEAGNDPMTFLENGASLCMCGEGEVSFTELACLLEREAGGMGRGPLEEEMSALWQRVISRLLEGMPGFAFLWEGKLYRTGMGKLPELDDIPFLYEDLDSFENRILYYESSRGCPFGCAYCLSGKERGVRYKGLELVKKELQFFLDHRVAQVKLIDRTFNASAKRALEIWTFLKERDNGVTNFHFEIEAGRMTQEEIELLKTLRPGLIQMEIGVQSANEETLRSVYRSPDLEPVRHLMRELVPLQNINLHLDLIAGLPYEDLESFRRSFCQVYELSPHQFQLGFLKLLPGTALYEKRKDYGLVASLDAPREILKTRWLSFQDLSLLHRISDVVEIYVNSQGFRHCLPLAEGLFEDAFSFFEALSAFLRSRGYEGNSPSLQNRYLLLEEFIRERWERMDWKGGALEGGALEGGVLEGGAFEGEVQEGEALEETGCKGDCAEKTGHKGEVLPEKGGREKAGRLFHILEYLRFDKYLHVHGSRRMQAEEVFDLGEGEVRYHFDYVKSSPVNGEALYEPAEGKPSLQRGEGLFLGEAFREKKR